MPFAPVSAELRLQKRADRVFNFLFTDTRVRQSLGQKPDAAAVLEVAQIWCGTVLDVRHLRSGAADLVAGGGAGADFELAADTTADGAGLRLFSLGAQTGVAVVPAGWSALVDRTGEREMLKASDQDRSVALDLGDRVYLHRGEQAFAARLVPPGVHVPPPLSERLDYPFAGVITGAMALATALMIAVASAPPPTQATSVEIPKRFAEMVLAVPPPAPEVKVAQKRALKRDDPGERAKRKEGRVGKRDAKQRDARGDRREMNRRQRDMEIATSAGVLGKLGDAGDLDGLLGSGPISADMIGGLGGAIGAKGVQIGSNGLASRGGGLGGGGRAVGIGGLSPRGPGGGDDGYGSDGGDIGVKSTGDIQSDGPLIALGGMDPSLIDRVMKRNMNSFRYCYQRELTRDPGLGGKITVRFVIGGDGTVSRSDIKRSSMDSAKVESCLSNRVMKLQFPKVQGGGVVMVNYPFLFTPG